MARERFVEVYSQGVTNVRKVVVDTVTGVNYLLLSSNMTGGCGVSVLVSLLVGRKNRKINMVEALKGTE